MSTITVTDLVPGTAATAAGVNATLNSWSAGTAAGSIVSVNVHMEGVDRRTMSADNHVVWTAETGNDTIVVSTASSGAVRSTGTDSVVICGIQMKTIALTIASGHRGYVHASIMITCASLVTGSPRLLVTLWIQESTDNGGTWAPMTGSRRRFKMRDVGVALIGGGVDIPGICASVSWMQGFTSIGGPRLYRIAFQTDNDGASLGGTDPIFLNATIYPEIIGA